MARGKARLSDKERKLRGLDAPKSINLNDVDNLTILDENTVIVPPKHYLDRTKEHFNVMIPDMLRNGVLSAMDLASVDLTFEQLNNYYNSLEEIKWLKSHKNDYEYDDYFRKLTRLLQWSNKAYENSIKGLSKLGATPTDRRMILMKEKEEKSTDPLDIVLGDM